MKVVLYIPVDQFEQFMAGQKVEALGGGQLNNTTVEIHVDPSEVKLEPRKRFIQVPGFYAQRLL